MANGVKEIIEEDLGSRTYKRVEAELDSTFGITMAEAVSDFTKMDIVLRKLFGKSSAAMEMRFFQKVMTVDDDGETITILNSGVAEMILKSYGNPVKKALLMKLLKSPTSIQNAIKDIELTQASAYRRAGELIRDGLLAAAGNTSASDGRTVGKYTSTFQRATFDVGADGLYVRIRPQDRFLSDSFSFNSILNASTADKQ